MDALIKNSEQVYIFIYLFCFREFLTQNFCVRKVLLLNDDILGVGLRASLQNPEPKLPLQTQLQDFTIHRILHIKPPMEKVSIYGNRYNLLSNRLPIVLSTPLLERLREVNIYLRNYIRHKLKPRKLYVFCLCFHVCHFLA